jgi:hypothetical protein
MSSAARVTKPPKRSAPPPPALPPLPVRRFTVEEYHKLGEIGVLTENDRVELIHGWIVPKMTIDPPHNYAVTALMESLQALQVPNTTIRVRQPITTTDSEPEPDVALVVGSRADYKARNPKPSECILVAEVADSSLQEDQTTKLELYARAKVAVYWIVNLIDRRVEVYTEPRGGKNPVYKKHVDYGPEDAVPVVIAGKELGRIPVKELLP